jgi:restriction endonuclease
LSSLYTEADPEAARFFVGRRQELSTIRESLAEHLGAVIYGRRGNGKTALLHQIRSHDASQYPGGVALISGQSMFHSSLAENIQSQLISYDKGLVIVDDAHALTADHVSELKGFLRASPGLRILIAADGDIDWPFMRGEKIPLGGLSEHEYYQLLRLRLKAVELDEGAAHKLWQATIGNPSFADIAGRTIRDNLLSWHELLESLEGFQHSGILDSSGVPISPLAHVPRPLVVAIEETNAELLERLRRNPKEFWTVSPRKFEEIIAELLERMDYKVELTPLSGDGGFDMYAAKKDRVGRFLFLVECKRYVPPHKVGVQIIRSLYGVVQQKNANVGIIATTSFFTKGAMAFEQEREHQMHLRDYLALQQWLKDSSARPRD